MATVRERTAEDGTITYQVLFRDGKKQRSKTFATPDAAQKFADAVRVLGPVRAVAELTATEHGTTLDEIAERFFEHQAHRVRSPRTVHDYRRDYANWIAEPLGKRRAESIDESDVQAWVDSMRGRLSPKSIADRHAILHGIYKYASAPTRHLIATGHNPCIGTELPERTARQPKGLRIGEWQALHAALNTISPDAADLAEFMVASGWRWSEAIALDTHSVDDDGRYVSAIVTQVSRRQSDGTYAIVEDAKSRAGFRRVRLDEEASAVVRRRVAAVAPGSLVFTRGGNVWTYAHFRSAFWSRAIDVANLERRPTIHWLRHTAVGMMHASGVSLAEIQRRIGHESIQTTIDVYGSMIDDVTDESLDRLAALRRGDVAPSIEP